MGVLKWGVAGGEELELKGGGSCCCGCLRWYVEGVTGSHVGSPEGFGEGNVYFFEVPVGHVFDGGRETGSETRRKGCKVAFKPT